MHLDPNTVVARALTLAAFLIGGSVTPSPVRSQTAPADVVIVVSIDGFLPEFYRDATWPAPFLQRIALEGASVGMVRGVFPSLTYPSHTSIATGALPIRHGVYYNTPFEPDGATGLWYWSFDSVRTTTIWEAAKAAGLETASIHWPVTLGAPIDYNVPEAWPLDYSMSRLQFLRDVSTPAGIVEEMEREATGKLVDYNAEGPTERWRYRFLDSKAIEMARYLLATRRPNLLTIHLLAVDDVMHDGIGTPAVRESVASVDALIGYLWESVDAMGFADRTTLIVTGDHGFLEVDTLLAPNVWLVDAGLRGADNGDWRATFHVKGGSAFLFVRDHDARTTENVVELLDGLPEDTRSRFTIIRKPGLVELGADTAAVLALAALPGTAFSGAAKPPAMERSEGATHGHLPDAGAGMYTGFIGFGAGMRQHTTTESIAITDVAPLVAYLLGLDFSAPDGRLPLPLIAEAPAQR